MKVQTHDMLIEDMDLNPGEVFQVGDGPNAYRTEYQGIKIRNGKVYDCFGPVIKK